MKKINKISILLVIFIFTFGFFSLATAIMMPVENIPGDNSNNTDDEFMAEEAPEECTAGDYSYSPWSTCSDNIQTRDYIKNSRCENGVDPIVSRSCSNKVLPEDFCIGSGCQTDFPGDNSNNIDDGFIAEEAPELCTDADYAYTDWGDCLSNNKKIRTYVKINNRCDGGFIPGEDQLQQSCTYNIPGGNTGGGGTILLPTINNPVNNFVSSPINSPVQQVLGEKIVGERWIRTVDDSTVYLLDDSNVRHSYPTENVWKSYFGKDFSFVETISNEELSDYTLGKNVQFKNGSLIKNPDFSKVYLVGDNFLIQWIKTEETASRLYGSDWNKLIYDFPEMFFGDYVLGDDIE
ncbi:MAG TPA: hypothetical protein PKL13_04565 [bacterium]|nr:hypothetical protein [bacterium]